MDTVKLSEMPSYSGLHYIMSKKKYQPSTSIELEEKYSQVDINHLFGDDLDPYNKIPKVIREEIEKEESSYEEGFLEELDEVYNRLKSEDDEEIINF